MGLKKIVAKKFYKPTKQATTSQIAGLATWTTTTSYNLTDSKFVEYTVLGISKIFKSLQTPNVNHVPTDAAWWIESSPAELTHTQNTDFQILANQASPTPQILYDNTLDISYSVNDYNQSVTFTAPYSGTLATIGLYFKAINGLSDHVLDIFNGALTLNQVLSATQTDRYLSGQANRTINLTASSTVVNWALSTPFAIVAGQQYTIVVYREYPGVNEETKRLNMNVAINSHGYYFYFSPYWYVNSITKPALWVRLYSNAVSAAASQIKCNADATIDVTGDILLQNLDTPQTPTLKQTWWNLTSKSIKANIQRLIGLVYSHSIDSNNPHSLTKSQIGLDYVTNDAQVKRMEMGAVNGVATLGSDGKLISEQVPPIAIKDKIVAFENSIDAFCANSSNYIYQQGDGILITNLVGVDNVLYIYLFWGGSKTNTANYTLIEATKVAWANVIGKPTDFFLKNTDNAANIPTGTFTANLLGMLTVQEALTRLDSLLTFSTGNLNIYDSSALGAGIVTGWTNNATNPYETLTATGSTIGSAINTAGFGIAYQAYNVRIGKLYKIAFVATLNSGEIPHIISGLSTNGATSQLDSPITNGSNSFTFQSNRTGVEFIMFYNTAASSFSISSFSMKELNSGNLKINGKVTGNTGTDGLSVDNLGYVGIGNTIPSVPFDVNTTANAGIVASFKNGNMVVPISIAGGTNVTPYWRINYIGLDIDVNPATGLPKMKLGTSGTNAIGFNSNMHFFTPAAGAVAGDDLINRMTILADTGCVGIGNRTPSSQLHLYLASASTFKKSIKIENGSFGTGFFGLSAGKLHYGFSSTNLAFHTNSDMGVDDTSLPTNERMYLNSTGLFINNNLNILIGSTLYSANNHVTDTVGDTKSVATITGSLEYICTAANAAKGSGTWLLIKSDQRILIADSNMLQAADSCIDLGSGKSGIGTILIGDAQEYANFIFKADGTVTLINYSANVVTTQTDAKLVIKDNGTFVRIVNELGASLYARIVINYNS